MAPFSLATTPRCMGGRYSFPWIASLYPFFIMLDVKQGSIKYHFLNLWYDSTGERTQVSRVIGEHSKHYANVRISSDEKFPLLLKELWSTINRCYSILFSDMKKKTTTLLVVEVLAIRRVQGISRQPMFTQILAHHQSVTPV